MHKNLLVTILFLQLFTVARSQDSTARRLGVSLGLHYGFLVAHRPLIIPLQQGHIRGLESNFKIRPDGSKNWHHTYGFPEMGISLSVWDLGNQNQLGKAVTLMPYLDFPLARGRHTSLELKFGWGLGYVEKIFDADKNYKNVALGSHLNYGLKLQPRIKVRINDHLGFNGGLSITHFSNGSMATPNLGLNLLTVTGGFIYKIGEKQLLRKKMVASFEKSSRLTFFGAASLKQVYPADGKNYYAVTVSGNHSWQLSPKSAIGFGGDVFYDSSINQKLEERNLVLKNSLQALRAGLHGSYELVIDDLSVIINMGGYLYTKLHNDGSIYHRIGLRYRLSEKLFVLMHLKSHWGKADYVEWGLGYRMDKRKSK
ncbi:MAG: acyloxyacyl hydrolase [Bacteroidota bacterium]|nr:acyloxyacyl hydrolase [Bacteroidota bacterium]